MIAFIICSDTSLFWYDFILQTLVEHYYLLWFKVNLPDSDWSIIPLGLWSYNLAEKANFNLQYFFLKKILREEIDMKTFVSEEHLWLRLAADITAYRASAVKQ